jgi:hypothetical protein
MDNPLDNIDMKTATKAVPDIKVTGDPERWVLLCKESSQKEGWMKSTKAMEIKGAGCVLQVTTQQRNPDGSYAVAEAIIFIPDVHIWTDENLTEHLNR